MVVLAILTLAGAFFATFVAWVAYAIECSQEAYSECSNDGRIQLGLAVFGLVLAFATFIVSLLARFRPGIWWCATALVYFTWVLIFGQYVSG